mmetsp:Transcript_43722/g.103920  ORF Transcript_43722/g.103920 Transcript_43722/m.103920 type:complete len:167 (-) Transcript_43722:47-547(-)
MPGARMRRRKQARDQRAVEEGGGQGPPDEKKSGKPSLFGDDGDDEEQEDFLAGADVGGNLTINKKFEGRFEHNEKLKDRMRLKELTHELGSGSESSTEEDEDGDLLTSKVDAKILETLQRIKNKDPAIYGEEFFFDSSKEDSDDEEAPKKKKEKKKKNACAELQRS